MTDFQKELIMMAMCFTFFFGFFAFVEIANIGTIPMMMVLAGVMNLVSY